MLPLTKLCRYIYLYHEEFLPYISSKYMQLNKKTIGISYDLIINCDIITLRIKDNSYKRYIYRLNKIECAFSLILDNSEIININLGNPPLIFYLKAFYEDPNFNIRTWNTFINENNYKSLNYANDKLIFRQIESQNYINHYKSKLPMYDDQQRYYSTSFKLRRTYKT